MDSNDLARPRHHHHQHLCDNLWYNQRRQHSEVRQSRAARALLRWRKECGWIWVLLASSMQASLRSVAYVLILIAGTLGCVFIDNETHESGVTKCTTGEAWSAFSGHHSSVFHCQWTHNQVFLLLSHMLIWNAKNIFIYVMKYVSGFIWKLGINFAVCIKWIDETWWNDRLLLVPNCYEVVAMVATMVAMVAPLWCHTLR